MEPNRLLDPNETDITGVHQIEVQETQQALNAPKPSSLCYGCGQPGHVVENCRKVAREACNRGNRVPNKIVDPCETCGKKSHTTQDCYSGANWANRPQWWKTPSTTPPNDIPITPQQGQHAKENSQVTQPQYQNQAIGQMGYLLPPQMTTQRQETSAKKLVLPLLQFGETVETRLFTISEPQTRTITKNTMSAMNNHLWTGSEIGKFTSSTNTTVKLRPKKTTHNGTLTTRPTVTRLQLCPVTT